MLTDKSYLKKIILLSLLFTTKNLYANTCNEYLSQTVARSKNTVSLVAESKAKPLTESKQNKRSQLKNLRHSLAIASSQLNDLITPSNLDKHVFDLLGHLRFGLSESSLRSWDEEKSDFESVTSDDIVAVSPKDWAKVARLAEAIEAPIKAYSDNSGHTLQALSPQAARFMGKTFTQSIQKIMDRGESLDGFSRKEIEELIDEVPTPEYCSNPWCDEEARHEGVLQKLANRIDPNGQVDTREEDFTAYEGLDPFSMKDAYFHLISRSDTEWHAASAYIWLFIHSKGSAQRWVLELIKDEIKHQAIFGGLYKYLKGDNYNHRLKVMLQKLKEEIGDKSTSSNSKPDSFVLTFLEFTYIHVQYEILIRDYLKSVPLKSLRKIYETEIALQDVDEAPAFKGFDKQAMFELIQEREGVRKNIGDWTKKDRDKAFELEDFEVKHHKFLYTLIRKKYNLFKGAETYDTPESDKILSDIKGLTVVDLHANFGFAVDKKDLVLVKKSLKENLRDYQIMNNSIVRNESLKVFFISPLEGFNIVPKETEALMKVHSIETLENTEYIKLTLERPDLFPLEAGDALSLTLQDTELSPENATRVFSLANRPNSQLLEFVYRRSDSAFKNYLSSMNRTDFSISVKRLTGTAGLNFRANKPAVMIAGGVGITPIRSVIQKYADSKIFKRPIHLVSSTSGSPLFYDEFLNIHSEFSDFFSVEFYTTNKKNLSKSNRLSFSDLERLVESSKADTVYYLVAPPKMISSITEDLKKLGVDRSQIVVEHFQAVDDTETSNIKYTTEKVVDADEIICRCMSVTKGQILNETSGSEKAGSGCGGCASIVESLQKQ